MALDYRLLFEKAPGICCVLSPDFRFVAVSDDYVRVSMRSRENLLGRVIFDAFVHDPDNSDAEGLKDLRLSLERVKRDKLAHQMPVQRYHIPMTDQAGAEFEERYWSPLNMPVLDDADELQYIIHTAQDVTAIVHLQRQQAIEQGQLAAANVALEAANGELEAFCYSVAHDLRAPLRGIQGFSQALLEDHASTIDQQGQSYLQRVSVAALRMSELIDDLLTLSRISRGPLSRSPIDLSAMARSVAEDMERSHDRPLRVVVASGLTANADARLMQIVFENLFGNAWKFTAHAADPSVEFGQATDNGETAFFVRDNGAGFDEAHAGKLFAPFQRLHSEKEFDGTGIGLATVQRIVRRHGGRVWARAAVDRGAAIYFTLPD